MGRYINTTVEKLELLPCPHTNKLEVAEVEAGLLICCTECNAIVRVPRRCECGRHTVYATTLHPPVPPLWFPVFPATKPEVRQLEQNLRLREQPVVVRASVINEAMD